MVIRVENRDEKILFVVNAFLDNGCRVSDQELSKITGISSSSIGRYLTSTRTRELIGDDNFAFIKVQRNKNKIMGRKKGGKNSSRKKIEEE